jgi:hypothetical protein
MRSIYEFRKNREDSAFLLSVTETTFTCEPKFVRHFKNKEHLEHSVYLLHSAKWYANIYNVVYTTTHRHIHLFLPFASA